MHNDNDATTVTFYPISVECAAHTCLCEHQDAPPSLAPRTARGFESYDAMNWPIVKLWGRLDSHQPCAVYVHGCFPTFTRRRSKTTTPRRFGQDNGTCARVRAVTSALLTPFYGYASEPAHFLRVALYRPGDVDVRRAARLLLEGHLVELEGRPLKLQPYESHVNHHMRFFARLRPAALRAQNPTFRHAPPAAAGDGGRRWTAERVRGLGLGARSDGRPAATYAVPALRDLFDEEAARLRADGFDEAAVEDALKVGGWLSPALSPSPPKPVTLGAAAPAEQAKWNAALEALRAAPPECCEDADEDEGERREKERQTQHDRDSDEDEAEYERRMTQHERDDDSGGGVGNGGGGGRRADEDEDDDAPPVYATYESDDDDDVGEPWSPTSPTSPGSGPVAGVAPARRHAHAVRAAADGRGRARVADDGGRAAAPLLRRPAGRAAADQGPEERPRRQLARARRRRRTSSAAPPGDALRGPRRALAAALLARARRPRARGGPAVARVAATVGGGAAGPARVRASFLTPVDALRTPKSTGPGSGARDGATMRVGGRGEPGGVAARAEVAAAWRPRERGGRGRDPVRLLALPGPPPRRARTTRSAPSPSARRRSRASRSYRRSSLLLRLEELTKTLDPDVLLGWDAARESWGYVVARAKALRLAAFDQRLSRGETPAQRAFFGGEFRGRTLVGGWCAVRGDDQLTSLLNADLPAVLRHVLGEALPAYGGGPQRRSRALPVSKPRRGRNPAAFVDGNGDEGPPAGETWYALRSPDGPAVANQPALEVVALNLEPVSAVYTEPVACLDFQSLYPSMVIAHNLCFSTCICKLRGAARPPAARGGGDGSSTDGGVGDREGRRSTAGAQGLASAGRDRLRGMSVEGAREHALRRIKDVVDAGTPPGVELKFEYVFDGCVLVTKKRYVGYAVEDPGGAPHLLVKGLEVKTRDNCDFVRHRDGASAASLRDLILWRKYRGSGKYRSTNYPLVHVVEDLDKRGNATQPGERVPCVVVRAGGRSPLRQRQRLATHAPALLHDIDRDYYVEKLFLPPLSRFLELAGVDVFAWIADWRSGAARRRRAARALPGGRGTQGRITAFFHSNKCANCGAVVDGDKRGADGACSATTRRGADAIAYDHFARVHALQRRQAGLARVAAAHAGADAGWARRHADAPACVPRRRRGPAPPRRAARSPAHGAETPLALVSALDATRKRRRES
ncbi:hypothetical protein JL720_14918 [Aureococcus anophagefferens]|nr:hypothetical protein JL720_14918 [Aureococcus anophagefferens]